MGFSHNSMIKDSPLEGSTWYKGAKPVSQLILSARQIEGMSTFDNKLLTTPEKDLV